MNDYMKSQILNMLTFTKSFEQACELSAIKNDGKIDAAEAKSLKKIKAATAKFRKALEDIN